MNYTKISELPVLTNSTNSAIIPVVDAGTTYGIARDHFVSQNLSVWSSLPKVSIPTCVSQPLAIGDNDIYTVPTGRRAIIASQSSTIVNNSGGTVTAFAELKHSGTYYRVGANVTVNNGATGTLPVAPTLIINAGDTLAVNAVTTAGAYAVFLIIEFEDTGILRTSFVFGTVSGDNTFYTVPADKYAIPFQATITIGTKASVNIGSGATPPGVCVTRFIANGGSPNINLSTATLSVANTVNSNMTVVVGMSEGDSLLVNATTGDPAQIIMFSVAELDVD